MLMIFPPSGGMSLPEAQHLQSGKLLLRVSISLIRWLQAAVAVYRSRSA
ncbi:hypothetical protein [Chamaesiphon sp. GL140_3_metabinner_50]|nr:hypothetical protein [Chamaesiphon sp. GL140_3_metabinner_50]